MVHTRPFEYEQDEAFIWELYCSTRTEEMALWGWSESDKLAFLQSQFIMQQKSYQMQFPAQNHQIILRSGQPIGRLITDASGDALHLVDISLLPAYRGQGVGSGIMGALQKEAEALKLPVRLRVLQGNPAFRLYERLHFIVTDSTGLYIQMEWQSLLQK
ncbi:GNAT family N-acetyltransferase [Brevibacillus formosus]|uniref:GNAT family N-acetyltransferase n=1 Tax=Brevibacillus formosus TaxID=54913 RepID=UPI001C67ABEB|nr:GNAT family N-acetyltransferase [Brevibacillus formosus]MBW5469934.1 GNAT family N-acetyltransferase [Brevibacillus formosus]